MEPYLWSRVRPEVPGSTVRCPYSLELPQGFLLAPAVLRGVNNSTKYLKSFISAL